MKLAPKFLISCLVAAVCAPAEAPAANKEARVTQVIRDVKLAPSGAETRPAAVNDQVREGIAVRTGDQSRSELTFPDVTISRLGANTVFTFGNGGHSVDLSGGSVLLRVPKASGGGNIRTNAVSVAVTGTTVILEAARAGRSKLMVLEGGARLSLVKHRTQSRDVRAGQMLDVPAGATTLPMPVNIDLNKLMKSHPLITGFPPLPSRDLIAEATRNPPPPEPVYQGQPAGQPVAGPVISIGGGFPGFGLPGLFPGSRPSHPSGPGRPGPSRPAHPGQPGAPPQPGHSDDSTSSDRPSNPGSTTTSPPTAPPKYQPTAPTKSQPTAPTKYQPTAPLKQSTLPATRIPARPRPTATPRSAPDVR